MKIKYFLSYTILFICIAFSYTEDFINSTLKQSQVENYSSLTLDSEHAFEGPVDPQKYKVGVGDQFLFSMIYPSGVMNMKLDVSPLGEILIPLIGKINVNDLVLNDAISLIKKKCTNKYENAEVNITLSKIREFKVKVIGAVISPGYQLASPINRVSDIVQGNLFEFIELNDSTYNEDEIKLHLVDKGYSSTRNIKLIRDNKTINVDLEMFKITGDDTMNPTLENGDMVSVEYIKDYVTISGAVQNGKEIEFKSDDTLYDVISLCGGLRSDSDKNISIKRLDDLNQEMEELIVSSIEEAKKTKINPNDYIYVRFNKNFNRHNLVSIEGEINNPGSHSIDIGTTTVKELIAIAGGYTDLADVKQIIINNHEIDLLTDSEFDRINLIQPQYLSDLDNAYLKARTSFNRGRISSGSTDFTEDIMNFKLVSGDEVFIPKKFDYIEVIGAVNLPGRYPFNKRMDVEEYLALSGGKTNVSTRKVYIVKYGTGQRVKFEKGMSLESGDIIFIPEKINKDKLETTKAYVDIFYKVIISILTINNILDN